MKNNYGTRVFLIVTVVVISLCTIPRVGNAVGSWISGFRVRHSPAGMNVLDGGESVYLMIY